MTPVAPYVRSPAERVDAENSIIPPDQVGGVGWSRNRAGPRSNPGLGIDTRRPQAHTDRIDATGALISADPARRSVLGRLRSPPGGTALGPRRQAREAVAEPVKAATHLAQLGKPVSRPSRVDSDAWQRG